MNQLQEYDLENQQGVLEQFLLLGFGTHSGRLRKSYDLRLRGEQELDGDAVVVLELTPKESEVMDRIQKVTLWVSEESWLPVQQRFNEPSGDYSLAKYGSVKVNLYLPSSKFRIQTRRDVTRLKMTR
jgi:outer membrane lipoprotein-sorting protein